MIKKCICSILKEGIRDYWRKEYPKCPVHGVCPCFTGSYLRDFGTYVKYTEFNALEYLRQFPTKEETIKIIERIHREIEEGRPGVYRII